MQTVSDECSEGGEEEEEEEEEEKEKAIVAPFVLPLRWCEHHAGRRR